MGIATCSLCRTRQARLRRMPCSRLRPSGSTAPPVCSRPRRSRRCQRTRRLRCPPARRPPWPPPRRTALHQLRWSKAATEGSTPATPPRTITILLRIISRSRRPTRTRLRNSQLRPRASFLFISFIISIIFIITFTTSAAEAATHSLFIYSCVVRVCYM